MVIRPVKRDRWTVSGVGLGRACCATEQPCKALFKCSGGGGGGGCVLLVVHFWCVRCLS